VTAIQLFVTANRGQSKACEMRIMRPLRAVPRPRAADLSMEPYLRIYDSLYVFHVKTETEKSAAEFRSILRGVAIGTKMSATTRGDVTIAKSQRLADAFEGDRAWPIPR
jgi:hypothetical protein